VVFIKPIFQSCFRGRSYHWVGCYCCGRNDNITFRHLFMYVGALGVDKTYLIRRKNCSGLREIVSRTNRSQNTHPVPCFIQTILYECTLRIAIPVTYCRALP